MLKEFFSNQLALGCAQAALTGLLALPGSFQTSLYAITGGAGSVIALMTWAGVIDWRITSLVPIGSMLIANAMNTNSLVLNRFRSVALNESTFLPHNPCS